LAFAVRVVSCSIGFAIGRGVGATDSLSFVVGSRKPPILCESHLLSEVDPASCIDLEAKCHLNSKTRSGPDMIVGGDPDKRLLKKTRAIS